MNVSFKKFKFMKSEVIRYFPVGTLDGEYHFFVGSPTSGEAIETHISPDLYFNI